MVKRILVPTDGTAASRAAVDAAISFAHDSRAEVVGLHVTPPRPILTEGMGTAAVPESEDAARECLGYVERRAAQAQVPAELIMRRADAPSEAILAAAREYRCDLIVMGAHAKGAGHFLPPGSQTTAVLRHGTLPVLVVPAPAK